MVKVDDETAKRDAEQATVAAAVDPANIKLIKPDPRFQKDRDADEARQKAVVDAVAKAGAKDLPKLGGPDTFAKDHGQKP
jgi:hypothetical protein